MKNLIKLFSKIASIDSPSGEEQQMADFIMNYLIDLGLSPKRDLKHMIYCRIGSGDYPKLFCAHMDTVEPGRGIKVIEENGYLVSKGETILGGDNKASLAAMLQAVTDLITKKQIPNLELLFSVREETNSGIRDIDTASLHSKAGLVFDGGGNDLGWIVRSAPWLYDFVIEIQGESSHASRPEEGKNTLDVLSLLLSKLKYGRFDEYSTFNIGLVNSGQATNTVPGNTKLSGDIRSTKKANFKNLVEHVEQIVYEITNNSYCDVLLHWIPYSDGYTIDESSENYKNLKAMYKSADIELNPVDTTGGSDANFLNSIGIETFCLGDGVEGAHTVEERISIKTFEKLYTIVKNLMLNY